MREITAAAGWMFAKSVGSDIAGVTITRTYAFVIGCILEGIDAVLQGWFDVWDHVEWQDEPEVASHSIAGVLCDELFPLSRPECDSET